MRFAALVLLGSFFLAHLAEAADTVGSKSAGESAVAAYSVQAGDKLNIQVYRDKDLSGAFTVDDSGSINYPLLGSVSVKGLTTEQVRQTLTERLAKDYVVDPQVQVDFEKSLNKSVMVLGQVSKPGNYDYTPDLTVLRLVLVAGGFTAVADLGKVKIIRTEKEGTKTTIRVNVKRITDGKDDDVKVESGDLVVVPESLF